MIPITVPGTWIFGQLDRMLGHAREAVSTAPAQ